MASNIAKKAFAFLSALTLASTATIHFTSTGNPILADGSYYSADPAPLVVDNTFYILAGHDTAGTDVNDFIMPDWQIFSSTNPQTSGGAWTLTTSIATASSVFSWAASGSAFAGQIVRGANGRYYLYAPVQQRSASTSDKFAIGVASSSSPLGPFTDTHPSGPIISQSTPVANNIHNIDPTVLVDDNGRVYMFYGSFNNLRAIELSTDMVTPIGSPTTISSQALTGYFEAPFLFKRSSTYYLLYAANNAGASSPCTPTSYHACIAYGTASSPLGPWTFRGVILDIVSSTTSHPGVANYNGRWIFTYHTADASGGTHFRRSVAIDELTFDDAQSPPRINKIKQTKRPGPPRVPTRNVALNATASSVGSTPIQYWIKAVNDGKVRRNPLPPEYWSSYAAEQSPATSTLVYTWASAVTINGTSIAFFADQPAGSNIGVAPPKSWSLEYRNSAGAWQAVAAKGSYPTAATDTPPEVGFTAVTTTSVRVVINASGSGQYAGVGVKEWSVFATTAQ